MGTSTQLVSRGRVLLAIGAALLAVGLLGLWSPVFLGDYDMYGVQVNCGNGYSSQLLQAEVDDQAAARRPAGDGAPAGGYVDRCTSALAHRRAWASVTVGLGAVTLAVQVAGWWRRRAAAAASFADRWSEAPDDFLHEAAYLDRRALPHRDRPSATTL
ncbi:MAG TPA: hypothetical protein VFR17_07075 [Mycobacterium sp.]|nr:hypothetical protein [Mycobacterium sp.]